MVTFVCYYCDVTLKKKQLEPHTYQCGRPPKFICIDCHKTFEGDQYKAHTNCFTEEQKYYGQYAKDKNKNKQQQQSNQQQNQQNAAPANGNAVNQVQKGQQNGKSIQEKILENQKKKKEAEKKEKVQEQSEEQETETIQAPKKVKKTIRKILQSGIKEISLSKLKSRVYKHYVEEMPEYENHKDIIDQSVDQCLEGQEDIQMYQKTFVKLKQQE